MTTIKKNLETVETLQQQIQENAEKIRKMKRADSELNLQLVVGKMNTDEENPREILRACYSYIAQHRALFSKKKTVSVEMTYGNHLE